MMVQLYVIWNMEQCRSKRSMYKKEGYNVREVWYIMDASKKSNLDVREGRGGQKRQLHPLPQNVGLNDGALANSLPKQPPGQRIPLLSLHRTQTSLNLAAISSRQSVHEPLDIDPPLEPLIPLVESANDHAPDIRASLVDNLGRRFGLYLVFAFGGVQEFLDEVDEQRGPERGVETGEVWVVA